MSLNLGSGIFTCVPGVVVVVGAVVVVVDAVVVVVVGAVVVVVDAVVVVVVGRGLWVLVGCGLPPAVAETPWAAVVAPVVGGAVDCLDSAGVSPDRSLSALAAAPPHMARISTATSTRPPSTAAFAGVDWLSGSSFLHRSDPDTATQAATRTLTLPRRHNTP